METVQAKNLHRYLRKNTTTKGRSRIRVAPKAERTVGGHVFASKAEAGFYEELKLEQHAAKAAGRRFLIVLQPKFLLAGVTYSADFLTYEDCSGGLGWGLVLRVYEVKGGSWRSDSMRRFRRDQRQMRELHGIEVQLVER